MVVLGGSWGAFQGYVGVFLDLLVLEEEDNKNWRFTLRETFSKNGRISEPQKF